MRLNGMTMTSKGSDTVRARRWVLGVALATVVALGTVAVAPLMAGDNGNGNGDWPMFG